MSALFTKNIPHLNVYDEPPANCQVSSLAEHCEESQQRLAKGPGAWRAVHRKALGRLELHVAKAV